MIAPTTPPEGFTLGPPPRGAPLPEMVVWMHDAWTPVTVSATPGAPRKLRMTLPTMTTSVSVRAGHPEQIAWRPAPGDQR